MDFVMELLKGFGTYFAYLCCGALGIWAGISFRKHKNKKKAALNGENA